MRHDRIETEKQRDARQADEEALARNAIILHGGDERRCDCIVCPVCHFKRLNFAVGLHGKLWASCLTAGCVEIIDQ